MKKADYSSFAEEHKNMLCKRRVIPVVLNAFGGPGAGKSTACMDICSSLKKQGYNAEYVQEYAKELVYKNRLDLLDGSEEHQFQILKEQMRRVDMLFNGNVDFIVTDSPILLSAIYDRELSKEYCDMLLEIHNQYPNFCFFINRDNKAFETEGRIHNFKESIEKDKEIKKFLNSNNVYYGNYYHKTTEKVIENAITTFNRLNAINK